MANQTVRVKGYRETMKAFRYIGGELNKEVRGELKKVGEFVRADAQSKALNRRMSARTLSGYVVRVRQSGIAVEQSRRKTTGNRPDFGATQMRKILVPARDENYDRTVEALEHAIDNLGREAGF